MADSGHGLVIHKVNTSSEVMACREPTSRFERTSQDRCHKRPDSSLMVPLSLRRHYPHRFACEFLLMNSEFYDETPTAGSSPSFPFPY